MTPMLKFSRRKEGNVAILFALALLPLMSAVGAAVDYSKASSVLSQLQADTDASALIACKSTSTTTAQLKIEAQTALNGYLPNYPVTIDAFTSTNNPRTVSLTTRVSYPTRFMRFANITSMSVSATSSCGAGENSFEVAMVLDTTGSMGNSAGGGTTKIGAMKVAATNFVNAMFTNFDISHLKMSVVPFAASVKVNPTSWAPNNTPTASWFDLNGTSAAQWQNVLNPASSSFTTRFDIFKKLKASYSAWTWGGCFEALPYPYNTQDTVPSSATPNTRYVPLFAPDEVGTEYVYGGWYDYGYQDVQDPYNSNSYMDDGTASTGACDNNASNLSTRMGQACKYVTPKYVKTSQWGPNWGCTSQALTQLTNNQAAVTASIATLAASGNTNIAEGLHWGWRTISSTGVFSDAVAYDTPNTTKVMVLMTDGVNQWNADSRFYVTGSEYSAYGYFKNADGSNTSSRLPSGYSTLSSSTDSRNAMDQLTRETCTNAKAKNIVIYTVAFSTPGDAIDASGQQVLKDCASGSDHFFLAADTASLNSAFAAIAQGIGKLRITK